MATGYLEAVWPGLFGAAFLRSGWTRGLGKAFQKVGGFAPHLLEGFPGSYRRYWAAQWGPAKSMVFKVF